MKNPLPSYILNAPEWHGQCSVIAMHTATDWGRQVIQVRDASTAPPAENKQYDGIGAVLYKCYNAYQSFRFGAGALEDVLVTYQAVKTLLEDEKCWGGKKLWSPAQTEELIAHIELDVDTNITNALKDAPVRIPSSARYKYNPFDDISKAKLDTSMITTVTDLLARRAWPQEEAQQVANIVFMHKTDILDERDYADQLRDLHADKELVQAAEAQMSIAIWQTLKGRVEKALHTPANIAALVETLGLTSAAEYKSLLSEGRYEIERRSDGWESPQWQARVMNAQMDVMLRHELGELSDIDFANMRNLLHKNYPKQAAQLLQILRRQVEDAINEAKTPGFIAQHDRDSQKKNPQYLR